MAEGAHGLCTALWHSTVDDAIGHQWPNPLFRGRGIPRASLGLEGPALVTCLACVERDHVCVSHSHVHV
jgi:hypothetical protein